MRAVYRYLFLHSSTRELKKRNTPIDDDDDHGRPGRRRQWSRSPPMHLPRRIPRTDPTEDMHGQLLVARRGRGRRLGAAIEPIASHASPASDPAHGSDGGHALAASGGSARLRASIRSGNSPSPRGPRMAMANTIVTTGLSVMAIRCRCWPFEAARP